MTSRYTYFGYSAKSFPFHVSQFYPVFATVYYPRIETHLLAHSHNAHTTNQGGGKAQEAAYIYDELIEKYGASPVLLNGLAVSKMHLSQWEEAETSLKEAITKVTYIYNLLFAHGPSCLYMLRNSTAC